VLSEASKGGRRDAGPRDEGRHNDADREMMQMIKELRNEVQELRREVKELRGERPKKDVSQDTKQPEIGVPVLKEIPYVGKLFGGEKPEKPANVKPKVSIEFDGKKLEGSDLELTAPKGKISIGVSKDGSGGLVGEIHLDADVKRAEQAAAAADTVETEVQKAKQQVKKLELEFKNQAGQAAEKAQKVEDVIREKLKDNELKFEQPKLEKLLDIKRKLKDAPIEKLEDIESKLKNAELELKKSAVKDEIDKANEELKQSLKKLDGEKVKAVDKQAIDETKLRYAEKAAQVSEAELDQALQANKRKPSSVSEAKLDEMKLRHKQALIEVDRAKHQLDEQLSRLKKQLENDAAGKKADTEAKPEKP
jgi:hypothetical protein